jgi:hypothetical protein
MSHTLKLGILSIWTKGANCTAKNIRLVFI